MKSNFIDNPVFRFASAVGDVFLLNLYTLLCCLPVVTAGAAFRAMLSITCKMAAHQDYSLTRDYFRALRAEFGRVTALWLGMLVFGGMILFDLIFAGKLGGGFGAFLAAAAGGFGLVLLVCFGWSMALLARFTYTRKRDCVSDALKLAAANPLPSLLMAMLSLAAPACLLWQVELFSYLLPLFLLFGVGIYGVAVGWLTRPAFRRLEGDGRGPEEQKTSEGELEE